MKYSRILAVFAVLCVVILAGEVMSYSHHGSSYSSDFRLSDNGFEYTLETGSSAEFEVLVSDNGAHGVVQKLYLHYDMSYGHTLNLMDTYVDRLCERLDDRGCLDVEAIDTQQLVALLSGPSAGVGLIMCSGAIPEEVADGKLVDWVKSGGTLYWVFDILGLYISKSDGTYHQSDAGLQKELLGAFCTSDKNYLAEGLDLSNPYSSILNLNGNQLFGSLDTSLIPGRFVKMGYYYGSFSEITFVECGSGTVCVVAGFNDARCISDVAQVVSSKITLDSELIYHSIKDVSHGEKSFDIEYTVQSGHSYSAFIYAAGMYPPYGKSIELVIP